MKELTAKKRDRARESRAEKQKEPGPETAAEPEQPEEETGRQDLTTLEGQKTNTNFSNILNTAAIGEPETGPVITLEGQSPT